MPGDAAFRPSAGGRYSPTSPEFTMKSLLACSAVVAVLGFVARADEPAANPNGPTLMPGTSALVMPVDAAGAPAPAEAAPLMMPQALPHYYGHGETSGYGCG